MLNLIVMRVMIIWRFEISAKIKLILDGVFDFPERWQWGPPKAPFKRLSD